MPRRASRSLGRALHAAVLGWVFLGIALGAAIGSTETLGLASGWGRPAEVLLQSILMSAVVVPGILLLRRRLDHRRLEGLGHSRSAARPLALQPREPVPVRQVPPSPGGGCGLT